MTSLVLLEFDASGIKQPSRSAVAAAAVLGEVHVLVAGAGLGDASAAAARLPGVTKVLVADDPVLDHLLAEPTAALAVARMIASTSLGSALASARAARAAAVAMKAQVSCAPAIWRWLMPVRSRIHSSDVSTLAASSALVTIRSGR